MTDYRQETIDTYNRSAKALAKYFRGIGTRVEDIERAMHLAGRPKHPRIVEIGCGDGRDAKEITKLTPHYTGFDISTELIKLAQKYVPKAKFEVADALHYDYPKDLDIVFAFGSLLHLDQQEVKIIADRVHKALKPKGIFYVSLKHAPEYTEHLKDDEHGRRLFYLYNPGLIETITDTLFKTENTWKKKIGKTQWFEMALRKI